MPRARSQKGEREAARILDAATAVLARDGMAGATLGRVATEAGVDKKMLVYYFSGRERLLAEVVRRVGQRLAENMEAAVAEFSEPGAMADVGVDRLWEGTTEMPDLTRAYLVLVTSSTQGAEV